MKNNKYLCNITVETNNNIGSSLFYKCSKLAKYKVNFKEGTSGKLITQYLCGIHYKALEKNVAKLKNICDYDSELKVEIL